MKKSRRNKVGEHRKLLQARGGWKETLAMDCAIEAGRHGHAGETAERQTEAGRGAG